MMNNMYTVKLHTSESELGELISLVGTMRHTTVVCADRNKDDSNGTVIRVVGKAKAKRKETEPDPRLVYKYNQAGLRRVNVEESLQALGLEREWLLGNKTKLGTAEHAVKMAMTTGRRKSTKAAA